MVYFYYHNYYYAAELFRNSSIISTVLSLISVMNDIGLSLISEPPILDGTGPESDLLLDTGLNMLPISDIRHSQFSN